MPRRNAKPRAKRTKTLSTRTLHATPAATVATARRWWDSHHLLDDLNTTHLDHDIEIITEACHRLDLTTFEQMLSNLESLLSETTGVTRLTQFNNATDSHALYRVRNHLGALLSAAAQSNGDDPSLVIAALPIPAPRVGDTSRRCVDDEILLLRQRAVHSINTGGRLLMAGLQYALSEAGAMPVETAAVLAAHFDHPRRPTSVALEGARYHESRTVALPRWTLAPLAHGLDQHLAQDERALSKNVAYGGKQSGNVASAAASAMLRRTLILAGLTEDCVEPKGVVKWRGDHTLNTHRDGMDRTILLLGKTLPVQVYNFLYGEGNGPASHTPPSTPEDDLDSFL